MEEEVRLKKVSHSGMLGSSQRVRMLDLVVMENLRDQELEILEEVMVMVVVQVEVVAAVVVPIHSVISLKPIEA
jgi:hypothetical protein